MNNTEMIDENRDKLLEEVRKEEKALRQKYNGIFSLPQGQDVLNDLKEMFYYYRSTFVPTQVAEAGEITIAFNEAQRNVIMHIENMMIPIEDEENSDG